MKITRIESHDKIELCNLNSGDLFEWNGALYIKTDKYLSCDEIMCIMLRTGEHWVFIKQERVYEVELVNELQYRLK